MTAVIQTRPVSPTPPPTGGLTPRTRRTITKLLLIVGLCVGAMFTAFPVVWMLSTSFKSNGEVFEIPARLVTPNFSFDAYRTILTNPAQLQFFLNSYIVAIGVTVATLFVSILAGFAFSRYQFPFKRFINVVIISVQAVPPITLVIPYFGLMVSLGLYNTHAGLILTHMVFTLPYAIIMTTAYFNTLPRELDESVKVDGGSSWVALWRILVPVSVPGLIAVGVYTFMVSWNEYLFALTLTRTDDMRTVPIGIQLLMGQHSYEWNQMMAMSILGSVPVLLLFVVFQRKFIGGLSAGAVKA